MKHRNTISLIVICLGAFVIFSGCFSAQNADAANHALNNQKSSVVVSSQPTPAEYWIRIDPVRDYYTDSTFNITGSTELVVKGTTNVPVGNMLRFDLLEENRTRYLLKTEIVVNSNNSGPNSFSYSYDMKGNPPGRYRVIIVDDINLNNAISRFNITSDAPFYKWIRIDPQSETDTGEDIHVSGTTDLPAGSQILIRSDIMPHGCTIPTPDKDGQRSLCGGSCRETGSEHIILVAEGTGGVNIWNSTVNSKNWCGNEGYSITVEAINWTNVTKASQSIRF